ncbi:MAG TPA: serine/threonine-protein kinase [Kofleriaceae bacterium]|nr:serine/threonine-protein kinase [Kofleriaceae bacterium]
MRALVGETVGSFRITDVIGQGGMGVVYSAEHVLLGKRAAVKVLLPERCSSREIVDRFFNEAKASTLIEDPGIVDIFDFGRMPDGNAYIVMELLDGETLGDRLKRMGSLSANQAAAIARHIAGTLAAAHSHGIIHRDLKPDNVFLVKDPALPRGERAKLLDFGIAKLASGTQPADMVKTETGRLMGTPYYMSPEQCRGAGKIDQRTDIYSLGCVLYQMLTGRPPFVLEGAGEILAAHIHVPPLPPRNYEPSVPSSLEAVVLRMLQKDPVRRFQSAEDVVTALNRAAMRFSGGEDAPEPSLKDSGVHRSNSSGSAGRPAFTEATTLSSSAGEMADWSRLEVSSRGRLGRLLPWLLGGAAASVAGALMTVVIANNLSGDDDRPRPAKAGAGARAVQPAPQPPPKPAPPPEPTPAEKDPIVRALAAPEYETVRLLVSSHPAGATVYRESDGVRLGKTPLEVRARRGRGEAMFILRRNGYRAELLAVPVDKDQERLVALRPQKAPAPSGRKAPRDVKPAPVPEPPAEPPDETETEAPTTPADAPDAEGETPRGVEEKAPAKDDKAPAKDDKAPAKDEKSRGKDDALDPFNLLRPTEGGGGSDAGAGKRRDKARKEKE